MRSKVSKKRVKRGKRIRFSGTSSRARPTQQLAIQKWNGTQWVTVGGHDRSAAAASFSKNQKIRRGGTYRVWTGSTTGQYASNVGKKFKIRSFR